MRIIYEHLEWAERKNKVKPLYTVHTIMITENAEPSLAKEMVLLHIRDLR